MTDDAPGADATPHEVRRVCREWIDANWDPGLSLVEWRSRLSEAGWAVPSWSRRWSGLGLASSADQIVEQELARVGAPGLRLGAGTALAAPTIMECGPDSVRERFLPGILTGETAWCQLFSEPGAGSDLAGLATTAVLDGDRWIVNGQKVWNTSADHADFAILLARTDWDVPKHRGLTYFLLPMRQAGVEVRPLLQMNRHSSFMEVFLTDAEIPRDHVVGEIGAGWSAAMTTLSFERRFGGASRPVLTGDGAAIDEARREADVHFATYSWYPQRAGRVDLVAEHAVVAGRSVDPIARQEIAGLIAMQKVSRWTAERARAARRLGRPPGAEGSIGKLASSRVARRAASVHSMLGGANAMLAGADGRFDGLLAEILVSVPAQSIAGGTDEIQKNILAERVLGLPREPAPDRDQPFRSVVREVARPTDR